MTDKPKKMTPAESGRLGGKKSRGGGRPKKYATDDERKAARVKQQTEYRKKIKTT